MKWKEIFMLGLFGLGAGGVGAAPWEFEHGILVTEQHGDGVFHHLNGSGQRHLAVGLTRVCATWEDNHTGQPRVYLACKPRDGKRFGEPRQISGEADAFEPSLVALPDGRFVVAWEEKQTARTRVVDKEDMTPSLDLATPAKQPTLAVSPAGRVYLAWSHREAKYPQIRVVELKPGDMDKSPTSGEVMIADREVLEGAQSYPSLVVTSRALSLAWEDRRAGHTRIFYAYSADDRDFVPPVPLNDISPRPGTRYGRGTGAMRPVLAHGGDDLIQAAWLDKRYLLTGYDVYGALSRNGGAHFDQDTPIQDESGTDITQWHVTVAGHDGQFAVAWDDDRFGGADIWLSWSEDDAWSQDESIPPASGESLDSSPSLAFDREGNLHLLWIKQQKKHGPSQLWYSLGRKVEEK